VSALSRQIQNAQQMLLQMEAALAEAKALLQSLKEAKAEAGG